MSYKAREKIKLSDKGYSIFVIAKKISSSQVHLLFGIIDIFSGSK